MFSTADSHKQYNCSFGFIDTTDATKFFRFVVTCNITE